MSMRITHGMSSQRLLADLRRADVAIAESQRQIATGKRLGAPSDDPAATRAAILQRADNAALARHRASTAEAIGWADATDTALGGITDIVHRARELVLQGANAATTPEGRERIAAEIDQLVASAKETANARHGDHYIFSGTATTTAPYSTASDAYAGDAGAVIREIGPGVTAQVNTLGSQILGSGQGANDGRLLDTLRDIADHLRSGAPADVETLRTTDLAALDANLTTLSSARASVGALTNRLEAASSRLADLELAGESRLSSLEDADTAQAVLELSAQQAAYQAALRSGAGIIQTSLMDFLR